MNSTQLDRVARSITLTVFAVAVAAFLLAPFLALNWSARPFPGFVVEQTLVVADIDGEGWSGRGAGLGYPQRVTHLDDRPVAMPADFDAVMAGASVGQLLQVRTELPDGSTQTYPTVIVRRFSQSDLTRLFWLPYVVGLLYLLIGAWVYRARGHTRTGRAFAFYCLTVALTSGLLFDLSTTHIGTALWTVGITQVGGALLGLALRFPEEWEPLDRHPALRFAPYLISVGLSVWGLTVLNHTVDPWAYVLPWRYSYVYAAVGLVFFLGMMVYRRWSSASAATRQQARIVLWGSLVSFAPVGVWLAVPMFGASLTYEPVLFLPGLMIFPLAVAYAIVRYRLLDVDRVLRLGLGYAVLTGIVTVGYALLITLLRAAIDTQIRFNDPAPLAVLVVVLVIGLDPLRTRVQRTVDRMFFRDRVDYRAALEAFSRDLTYAQDLSAILSMLRQQLDAAWHPSCLQVFLNDERAKAFVETEAAGAQPRRLAADSRFVGRLAREEGALTFGASGALPADAAERDVLAALGATVFVPLRSRERLIGWLSIGPRLSGRVYHGDDLAFLVTLANQAALAIERARLQERAVAERQLRRELELARRIQHSFLPQQLPRLPGWEFSAFYAAARAVGGDFYDIVFLDEPSRRPHTLPEAFRQAETLLGLTIADVSDKGVPAALFMAVTRTLVRAVTIGGRAPAEAIRRVNQLIQSDIRSDQFVTLFYGILDPGQAALRFVNAGHNPPLLVRGESGVVFSLRAPGIVLGIFPDIHLSESEAVLEPGDVLLMYTDGVTDAIDGRGEEMGAEHLTRLLIDHRHESAEELMRTIVGEVRAFVGDSEPYDDMTLMIVKRSA